MEIEMKLAIPDSETADRIAESSFLRAYEKEACREAVRMDAVYYDTEDGVLAQNHVTFRVRQEGSCTVSTVKWGGQVEEGLFSHQECNVPAAPEDGKLVPRPELFRETDAGPVLERVLAGKPLCSQLGMHFLRRRTQVVYRGSELEVSVDTGEIVAGGKTEPICEVEVELFAGPEDRVREFAQQLADEYRLVPENRSKYARGLALMEHHRRKES